MKYKILLNLLTYLIYGKRFTWWLGGKIANVSFKLFGPVFRFFGYFFYRADFLVEKKLGFKTGLNRKIFQRDNLQILILLFLFFLAIPQTKLYSSSKTSLPGRNTIAYSFVSDREEFGELEEVVADNSLYSNTVQSRRSEGAISQDDLVAVDYLQHNQELASTIVAGGTAISKPALFPGNYVDTSDLIVSRRSGIIEHEVQSGETISEIALRYGVSPATILWENDLSSWSLLQLGDKLRILPTNGLRHTVKSGDTLIAIANLYGGGTNDIIKYNDLSNDGSDLKIGQKIIVPDGVKKYQAIATTPSYTPAPVRTTPSNIPASSGSQPSSSGFVWPCAMRTITQYYNWGHHGLDISGPIGQARGSAIYASKSGTVEVAAYGWNMGYGNYIIINHGGGYKTLYGHNQELLVNVGDYVNTGQTISLMGNTGRVWGYDGTHIHFEVRVNGVTVNPLNYVR